MMTFLSKTFGMIASDAATLDIPPEDEDAFPPPLVEAFKESGSNVVAQFMRMDRGDESGFNWWSQHLDLEVSYGRAGGVGDRADGACADEVAGQAVVAARSGAGALGWRTPAETLDEHLRSIQQTGVATTD